MESAFSEVVPWASLHLTEKDEVPAEPPGTPLITPVPAASVSPDGSEPEMTDQLYGVVPPVAESVWGV